MWLASDQVQAIECSDSTLTLSCPTPLFRVEISKKFSAALLAAATAVLGQQVRELAFKTSRQNVLQHQAGVAGKQAGRAGRCRFPPATGRFAIASRGYKMLRDFVVGSCNRVAYDAVRQVIEQPGSTWNPLFIHGASGLGKTHLEQGLWSPSRTLSTARVQYPSCEQFKNQYLHACESTPYRLSGSKCAITTSCWLMTFLKSRPGPAYEEELLRPSANCLRMVKQW